MVSYQIIEIINKLMNLIRVVNIVAVDIPEKKAKAKFNNIETPFLKWTALKAGATNSFIAPEIGEQALLLSPGGNLNQGILLLGLYQNDFKIDPIAEGDNFIKFKDGTKINYNTTNNLLDIKTTGGIKIKTNGAELKINNNKIELMGDLKVTGEIKASGDIMAGLTSLKNHIHTASGQPTTAPTI